MPSTDPILTLVNYGVLGLVLVLIVLGHLAPGRQVRESREDAEAARAALNAMSQKMIEEVVPALTRVTDATARATDALLTRASDVR